MAEPAHEPNTSYCPTGVRHTSKQVDALPISYHDFHGQWNYTIRPEPHETPVPARKPTPVAGARSLGRRRRGRGER